MDIDELGKAEKAFIQVLELQDSAAAMVNLAMINHHYRDNSNPEIRKVVILGLHQANEWEPEWNLPLRNLGAALFEYGYYHDAVLASSKALLKDTDDIVSLLNLAGFALAYEKGEIAGVDEKSEAQLKALEATNFLNPSSFYIQQILRVCKKYPDKYTLIPISDTANEVLTIQNDPGCIGSSISQCIVFKRYSDRASPIYEARMIDMMDFMRKDYGLENSLHVPDSFSVYVDDDETSYLVLKYSNGISLDKKVGIFSRAKSAKKTQYAAEITADVDTILVYMGLVHAVLTDLATSKRLPEELRPRKTDLLAKLRSRLECIPLQDEEEKRRAVNLITENYHPVLDVLNATNWVYNKDSYPGQWLVNGIS